MRVLRVSTPSSYDELWRYFEFWLLVDSLVDASVLKIQTVFIFSVEGVNSMFHWNKSPECHILSCRKHLKSLNFTWIRLTLWISPSEVFSYFTALYQLLRFCNIEFGGGGLVGKLCKWVFNWNFTKCWKFPHFKRKWNWVKKMASVVLKFRRRKLRV